MTRKCTVHPGYTAQRKPMVWCPKCAAMWNRKHKDNKVTVHDYEDQGEPEPRQYDPNQPNKVLKPKE